MGVPPADDRTFPSALAAVAGASFNYCDDGIDYEPYAEFLSAKEATDWIRSWTGNGELDGDAFRVFGQDGAGGLVALWLIRPGRALVDQPVVFFGSEGELGVLATELAGFLWLLADGLGPHEAVFGPDEEPRVNPELTAIAERFAPGPRRAAAVIETAAAEFPDFESTIEALCR